MESQGQASQSTRSSRTDPGWKYCHPVEENNTNDVVCNFCAKVMRGGITRAKQHLMGKSGNVSKCPKCPKDVKDESWALYKQKKKKQESDEMAAMRDLDLENLQFGLSEDDAQEILDTPNPRQRRGANLKGPMDLFFIKPEIANARRKKERLRQQNIREACDKEAVARVHQYIARWWYQAELSFNCIILKSFRDMLAAIGNFGPNLPSPSYHDIRVPLLNKELEYTKNLMKDHKEQWDKHGCSIMSDAWTDRKQRCLINFLVNSPAGTMFVKSIDGSNFVKTGDRRRLLLRGLTQSLPEILPLLYNLLQTHFVAALNEAGRNQMDVAKLHAATVTAALNAVNAYAEWAPLSDLADCGIINGCGFLLSAPDFRLHACEFFKLVSPRKRPIDASASKFDQAMISIFQILMNISREFLYRSGSNPGSIDEGEYEFSEYICENMVLLGSSNLQSIAGDSNILPIYLEQMLGFFRHFKFAIHFHSLNFWLVLMRDLLSRPKSSTHSPVDSATVSNLGSENVENAKRKILSFVNDDFCGAILDTSFPHMLKREKILPETALSLGVLELWSDDFDGKGEFSQYRSRLLELIRFVSSYKPLMAAAKVSEKIDAIIKSVLVSPALTQDLAVMESMQLVLENVVNAVFDESNDLAKANAEVQFALRRTFEGLLQQFLSLKWTEPALVEVLAHYFDAMGPFLKYSSDAVGSVVNKLFELLTSLPFAIKDTSTLNARRTRLQICTSFIRIAKAADKSILPHMKGIADTIICLQRDGSLHRGEHNLLGEAFLVMASAAGIQQQQEVLAWLLEPLSQEWTQSEWQDKYLSDPQGLVGLFSEAKFMWSIFHNVTFFEKALKRSGMKKANWSPENISTPNSTPINPMAPHVSWMLTPLLKLLRAIHSLWSPSVRQALPGEIQAAMIITDAERFSLLGEGNPKLPKGSLANADKSKEGYAEPNESDIRNWLKGIRDSGYNVLGLTTTIGDSFFKYLDVHSVAFALMENIQYMEFRHIRQLVHSILIPLVRYCPLDMWEIWLEKLLRPLFVHAQQVLSCSWSSFLQDGRAKVPDVQILGGSDLKVELMEEKLLRDLTREICSLFSVIASPPLNPGIPSLEQSGHVSRLDMSSLKSLDTFASSSMVGFLLKHGLALPTLQICLEAFTWTDGDAVTKISPYCSVLVVLSIVTNHSELIEFVSKDLFSSIIQGLALESNAIISADLVGLCREIFVYLCDRHPAPRQVLLSLPLITPQDLLAFEESLTKTLSPKEQKQHMRSLLMLATGSQLKALAAQKSVNVITNVSLRPRSSTNAPESKVDDEDAVGLAAII